LVITWRDIRDSLFHRTGGPPHLVKWANDVVSLIEKGGGRAFAGLSTPSRVSRLTEEARGTLRSAEAHPIDALTQGHRTRLAVHRHVTFKRES
jgi:hypothetical protein